MHNYKLSPIQVYQKYFTFKHLNVEAVSTNSTIQKCDGQKTWNFFVLRQYASPPYSPQCTYTSKALPA